MISHESFSIINEKKIQVILESKRATLKIKLYDLFKKKFLKHYD